MTETAETLNAGLRGKPTTAIADELYAEALAQRELAPEWGETGKLIEFLQGRQYPSNWDRHLAAPVVNRVWDLFWEEVSQITDLRIFGGKVRARRGNDQAYIDAADALGNALKGWWTDTCADEEVTSIVQYAMLSTGYGKVQYSSLMNFGEGDFELVPFGMDRVMPVSPGRRVGLSEAIVLDDVRSLRWFRRNFGEAGASVRSDFATPVGFKGQNAAGFSRASTSAAGVNSVLAPMISVPARPGGIGSSAGSAVPASSYQEFWIDDDLVNESESIIVMGDIGTPFCYVSLPADFLSKGDLAEPVYPRKRLIVRGGKTELYDGPSPFYDGEFPFCDLRLNRVPWAFPGLSEMRPWVSPSQTGNELLAMLLQSIRKQMRPTLLSPKNSVSAEDLRRFDASIPGKTMVYHGNSPNPPRFEQHPPAPAYVMQVLAMLGQELDRSSGIGAASQAIGKKQVPGGDTFERMRFAQSTPLRLKERALEIFVRRLAFLAISRVCQFYTENRMFEIGAENAIPFIWKPSSIRDLKNEEDQQLYEREIKVREKLSENPDYSQLAAAIAASDGRYRRIKRAIQSFGFYIKPGSLIDFNRGERIAIALRLMMARAMSIETMYRIIDADVDPKEELKRIAEDVKALQGAGVPTGPQQRISKASHQQGIGKVVPDQPTLQQ